MDPEDSDDEEDRDDGLPFHGVKLDDGTGKNVYYINLRTGKRTRAVPATYTEEFLENGDKRFVNRGRCQRCKLLNYPSVYLTREQQSIGYCVNYCENCLLQSVRAPNIKTLRGSGDLVYAANVAEPKLCYINLQRFCCDEEKRESDVMDRALYAKFYVSLLPPFLHSFLILFLFNLSSHYECTSLSLSVLSQPNSIQPNATQP